MLTSIHHTIYTPKLCASFHSEKEGASARRFVFKDHEVHVQFEAKLPAAGAQVMVLFDDTNASYRWVHCRFFKLFLDLPNPINFLVSNSMQATNISLAKISIAISEEHHHSCADGWWIVQDPPTFLRVIEVQ